ncbi:MAG: GAF domain-containing protein, partial [Verrucomicrobia bacterium]|nr:GAF domain-containing protein [Verrucomicrobiota bacterium]
MKKPVTNSLRVIYLEDQARDRELVAAALAAEGLACEIIDARNREEFNAALAQQNIGLILCDYTLPSYGGSEALAAAKKLLPDIPFIFVSGTIGEERAVESLRSGATDYVLKDRLERLAPVVRRALRETAERHYRKEAEQRIGELNLLLRAIRDIDRLIVQERDPERLLTEACRSLVQTRGYHAAWIGLTDPDSKRVAPAAHAGKGADSLAATTVTWDETPTGQGATGTAIRTRQPWVCQNIATDPRFEPWKAVARANELASVAAVPMIRGDRTLGAITVYSQRVGAFHGEELGLLGELAGDLAYALENIDHERRRKHAEASMERNHAEMAAIYDAIPLMICLVNSRHQVERVNRTMTDFGVSPITIDAPQPPGSLLGCIYAQEDPRGCGFGKPCETCPLRLAIARTSKTGEPCQQVEAEKSLSSAGVLRKVHLSVSTALVRLQDQPKVLVCLEDITGRKLLEQQLRQAQKMEAIGLLAGGVAHDFNNLLAIMRGNAELLLAGSEQHSEATSDGLRHIVTATERAANLTRQLLAFGRKQVMQAQPLNLNDAIVNLARMLKRIIGENIDLKYDYTPEPVFIHGDVGMLEQVLVNLVVNARDAITHGGNVRLATERLNLDADYVRAHPEARTGEFVRLSVSDNGTGIA